MVIVQHLFFNFQDRNAELRYCIQKFHVLALGRIDEETERYSPHPTSPRPATSRSPCLVHGPGPGSANGANNHDRRDLCPLNEGVPLDARKLATLYRHYYPEGGWGWVVIVCSVLVHILTLGLQLSCSQLVGPAQRKFGQGPVNTAG